MSHAVSIAPLEICYAGSMERRTSLPADDGTARFRMVVVEGKPATRRRAVAQGRIRMSPATLQRVREGTVPKGDPLSLAEVAGILAAKRTPELLPLCHPLPLDSVRIECALAEDAVLVQCEAIATA